MKRKNTQPVEIKRYNPEINEGLSNAQVQERVENNLVNNTKIRSSKSFLKICLDNIFTFVNLILVCLAVALIAVQSYNDLLFMIVVVLNTLIAIVQEVRSKVTVEKLSLVTIPKVKVIRNCGEVEIQTNSLVLDDIVKLQIGNQIPTDCIVLDGNLEVNESLLTGESDAVKKKAGDILYSGSFIISGSCIARVDKIGKDSYIQSIASEARKFKSPNSRLNRDLNSIIKYIGIFIIPVAGLMFANNYFSYGKDIQLAIAKTCGSLIGMIPSGMFLLISIALAVGVIKLSKRKTLVQDLYSIEMLARSNVLCLDKTGTITDGTMQVSEVIELNKIGTCDTQKIISNILNNQTTSNSTSNALIKHFGKDNKMQAKYNMEFSSKRKFTATSFARYGTFVMGAPEFVNCKLTSQIKNLIYEKSAEGKRVLLVAHTNTMLDEKEQLAETTPVSIITIEDHIREDAPETIAWFKENGVTVKIISGDNPITVSSIAKRVGVENAEACVSLEGMSLQEVEQIADKFTVFGRVSPEQKHMLIKTLKKQGNTVAMTGDGVNDTLALKEADCSIAMADGSEVARNLSNLVLLDSKFSSLPAVVKEGRQVVNNVQQSSTLYLMKTLFTILLSLFTLVTLSGYPFQPRQLFILELLVIGLPSVILALQPNTRLIQGDFIPMVLKKSIPSGFMLFVGIFAVIMFNNGGMLNAEEFETLCTLTVTLVGFVNLIFLCLPFNKIRVGCLSLSFTLMTVVMISMGGFFGITAFSWKVALIVLVSLAITAILHMVLPKVASGIRDYYKKKNDPLVKKEKFKNQKEQQKAQKQRNADELAEYLEQKDEKEQPQTKKGKKEKNKIHLSSGFVSKNDEE